MKNSAYLTIPNAALSVIEQLNAHHHEAFFVGGCVRDYLMHRPIHDYDITTSALPHQVQEIFQDRYKILPIGLKHGTLTIIAEDLPIEVTTYRIERDYLHHRAPSRVEFTDDLFLDLARRDFTINAMAMHPSLGIVDPFHGQSDLKNGCIRCVGDPRQRLEEDALRILRAIRFYASLHFSLDPALRKAIQEKAALLTFLSKERIRDELNRILASDQTQLLHLLHDLCLLPYLFPSLLPLLQLQQETPWHLYDVFTHTDIALDHSLHAPLAQRLALIYHDCGKALAKTIDAQGIAHFKGHAKISAAIAKEALEDLHYDKKSIQLIYTLILYHDTYIDPTPLAIRQFLSKLQFDYALADQILAVQHADNCAKNPQKATVKNENIKKVRQMMQAMKAAHVRLTMKDLAINGKDLLAIHFHGKQIKEALELAYAHVIEQPQENTKELLLNYIQQQLCKNKDHS